MAEIIRKVDYFKITTADKPGQGARILGALRDAGINLLAFAGFPRRGRAQIDFIPEDTEAFKKAAKQAGLKIGPKKSVFLIQGEDRPGVIADLLERLAEAKINVTAVDAVSAGEGRYGAILWVKPAYVAKTVRVLGAL